MMTSRRVDFVSTVWFLQSQKGNNNTACDVITERIGSFLQSLVVNLLTKEANHRKSPSLSMPMTDLMPLRRQSVWERDPGSTSKQETNSEEKNCLENYLENYLEM